jgi:hypothetical protein
MPWRSTTKILAKPGGAGAVSSAKKGFPETGGKLGTQTWPIKILAGLANRILWLRGTGKRLSAVIVLSIAISDYVTFMQCLLYRHAVFTTLQCRVVKVRSVQSLTAPFKPLTME